ncbi:MAG: N-6 DNA methylase [Bacteroidota bacterium]
MSSSSQLIKETGATFTPPKLADFISGKILKYLKSDNQPIKVLDPACGEGVLLASISRRLNDKDINFDLIGFDSNEDFLEVASKNLENLQNKGSVSLHLNDFLEKVYPKSNQTSLFNSFNPAEFINESIDLVIANPPYVRTQILGSDYAQRISKKFNLKGRVDLYYPFLIGMTYALKENGLIGVITSNRYLTTKSGISVRKFLRENYEILEIIDLGDTKLFDAAVLPAIFIGRKKSSPQKLNSKFTKVYEELSGLEGSSKMVTNFYDILEYDEDGHFTAESRKYKKTSGYIRFIKSKEFSWALLSKDESIWIDKIDESASQLIGNLFKVRVGIKSTADKIFIRENWEEQESTPEKILLRDLISQENIETWNISESKKLKVLYPHISNNGKKETVDIDKYPKAKKYLTAYKEKLSSRKYLIDAGRQWYELWVPQNPAYWDKPKLVFPDISSFPRFYFDQSKRIVNGNCYWMVAQTPEEVEMLLLIQGISNSLLMTKYHDLMFNNKLYSGRRRYFSQYVEKYPIPGINSEASQKVISIVRKLNKSLDQNKESLISELEIAVAEAFNVEPVFSL